LGLRGQYVFNSAFVRIVINIALLTAILSVVAYLSAKAYLISGSLTLLIITIAFVYICIVTIAIGWIATLSPNWGVTLNGIDLLVFSALLLLSSFQASFRSVPIGSEHRKARLTLACLGGASISGIMTLLTMHNVFPIFFVNGVGVTLSGQIVFSIAVLLFSLSAVMFLRLYFQSKSRVLYWFTIALVLDALGSFGVTLQLQFSDIVVWTGRIGIYAATIYFLIALLSSREN
jgi:hypothetical protein